MGILITGVNGFIGHYLANKFLSKNIEVYGVYRNNIPQIRNKNFFKVNINNKNFSIPKNISTIFHLAAESPGKYNNKNFIKNNLEITKKILKYCKDKNIKKIFYFSSIVVYEQFNKKKKILNEDMKKIKPKSSYARSKIICENFVKKQTEKNLKIIILRLPAIVAKDSIYSSFNNIKKKIENNNFIKIINPNDKFNGILHIKDLVRIVFRLYKKNKLKKFNLINLGSKYPLLFKNVIFYMSVLLKKKLIYNFTDNNNTNIISTKKINELRIPVPSTKQTIRKFILE